MATIYVCVAFECRSVEKLPILPKPLIPTFMPYNFTISMSFYKRIYLISFPTKNFKQLLDLLQHKEHLESKLPSFRHVNCKNVPSKLLASVGG